MMLKDVWKTEKLILEKCIKNISYDEVLLNTLLKLPLEIENSIESEYNCVNELIIIIETLESKRYIEDILNKKASADEKELVNELLNTLYLLVSVLNSVNKTKLETIQDKYKIYDNIKIPNNNENVNEYKKLYEKDENRINYTEINNLNKYKKGV